MTSATAATVEYPMRELLEHVGCKLRGNHRADCNSCGGRRTTAYTDDVYFCHRCGAKGNAYTLARELGLARRLPPAEARKLYRRRELGKAWGRAAYERARTRRFDLYEAFRSWVTILCGASEKLREDLNDQIAWEALALAYQESPKVQAELAILEDAPIAERVRFLAAGPAEREERIQAVINQGGVVCGERFIPLTDPTPAASPHATVAAPHLGAMSWS